MSPLVFPAVFALSCGLVALLTPLSIWAGKRWNLVDLPGGRRKHKGEIVRIGGLAIYPPFLLSCLLPLLLGVPRQDKSEVTRLAGILIGMGIVWIMGLLDDRLNLPPWAQLAGLLLAAFVAVLFRIFIELFNNPFADSQVRLQWYLMLPLTLVWIIGITGTVNMLDGLDGLATGVMAISALVLFVHMIRLGQHSVSLIPLALLGCCVGFLPYNFSPARIFLGGGAYVLGYALSTASIVAGAKVASALLVLWLPLVDVLWQVYTRWRRGQALGLGDRGHLHFRLQDSGWSVRRIVLLYYAITLLLGGLALLSPSRLLKLAILLIAGLGILLALARAARQGPTSETGR